MSVPNNSSFTSFAIRFWSSLNCFSISLLFFASGSSLFPLPKHMILGMAIHWQSGTDTIDDSSDQLCAPPGEGVQ